jgi:hypothetical protein
VKFEVLTVVTVKNTLHTNLMFIDVSEELSPSFSADMEKSCANVGRLRVAAQKNVSLIFLLLVGFWMCIQGTTKGEVNILGGHSIDDSKQKYVHVYVSYSERSPR